jgi:hypothetical protein
MFYEPELKIVHITSIPFPLARVQSCGHTNYKEDWKWSPAQEEKEKSAITYL